MRKRTRYMAAALLTTCLSCGPTNMDLINSAYRSGHLTEEQYINMVIDEQTRQSNAAMAIGAAMVDIGNQSYNNYYWQNNLAAQQNYWLNQQSFNNQLLQQNQQMMNLYMLRGR